ncbi:MAG: FtsQ-type POTRA domain-containing protein [Candidatus Parcubacteria bacterium]|nr:FtsQ-type POTRA domain-containing protein [Candidatus Parcubacteria bacterium]
MLRLKKKRFIKKLTFLFLIPLFIFVSVIALFYVSYFRIKKISIEGNSSIDSAKIMADVSNYLSGKNFKIFPRDNFFIMPKKEFIDSLLKEFPRLKTVSLIKNFPNSISIKVEERNNEAIFCLEEKGECFFIDKDGFVFEPAPYFSAGVYLTFLEEATSTWKSSFQVIPKEQFKKLIDFKNLLTEENIKILQIIIKNEGIYQLQTNEGWYILLNEQNDSQITYQNLKITLNQIKDKRKNLDYIDLRFGNKVFYKFK